MQATLAFAFGWGARGSCKLEIDLDSGPQPLLTRILRLFTG